MNHYYFDTSALVKYYVPEAGSTWVTSAIEERHGEGWSHVIVTSTLTWAELISALSRRRRSGSLTAEWYATLIDRFLADGRARYARLPADDITVNLAVQLLRRHPLRAYDAVQLATALKLDRALAGRPLSPVAFVSADSVLCEAARAEGLTALNPNDFANEE